MIDSDLDGSGAIDASNEVNALLAPSGSRLPNTPKFKGNIVTRYEFPLSAMDGHVQLAVGHNGARRNDLRPFENGIMGPLGAYTTVDFSFGVKNDSWSAELFATNLLDSNGKLSTGVQCLETVCGDPDGLTGTGGAFYETVIRPRLIGIKVSKKF